jgi:hypothetical protein
MVYIASSMSVCEDLKRKQIRLFSFHNLIWITVNIYTIQPAVDKVMLHSDTIEQEGLQ